jgi:Domain of unknown function (DUF4157)
VRWRLPLRKAPSRGPAAPRAAPPAWTAAPPLRPSAERSTIPERQRSFLDRLAVRKPIAVTERELAHTVAPEAPAGVVAVSAVVSPPLRRRGLQRVRDAVSRLASPITGRPDARPGAPEGRSQARAAAEPPVIAEPPLLAPKPDRRARVPAETLRPAPPRPDPVPPGHRADREPPVRPRPLQSVPPAEGRRGPVPIALPRTTTPASLRPATIEDRVEQPPPAARARIERHFGADLARVPIRRGRETATLARRLRAQAFTAAGEVHVPAEVGPLDTGRGEELLTHELVHVVQQRSRPAEPAVIEASPQGRALEEEAQRLAPAPDAAPPVRPPRRPGVVLSEAGAELARLKTLAAWPEPGAPAGAPSPAAAAPPAVQRAAEAPAQEAAGPGEPSQDELLSRLYEQFSRRLRSELLVDRERAGILADR